jgi:hypothetical protein
VLGGDGLSFGDRRQIDAALATAKRFSDLDFDAYLGPAGDDAREYALALHSRLARPDLSVLVLCDPQVRALEIVTGQRTRQYLDDAACRLAVATMTSSFLRVTWSAGWSAASSSSGRQPTTPRRCTPPASSEGR